MSENNADASAIDELPINGGPTKRFFVSMLTKDIDLSDAILDLVDNCVDGAMRQRRDSLDGDTPFEGFKACLTIEPDLFKIDDNCGGIPEAFVGDAFSLGRPKLEQDGDLPTIGMFGIGMKRAIFKMGEEASVSSNSLDGNFIVNYSRVWLDPDNDEWELPISRTERNDHDNGVTISIPVLKDEISVIFKRESFLNKLKDMLSVHFGYIMQKGFEVYVNGEKILMRTLPLLSSIHGEENAIRAYDYEAIVDDVQIKVIVGFYRKLAKETDIDKELMGASEQESAGVSIICNDRVVLLNDRTMKTGWGDGGVPKYHSQFRSIAGLIIFTTNNAGLLPVTTTKNAIQADSHMYYLARKACMEGIKTFTNFTNKWKGMEDEATPFFEDVKKIDARSQISLAKTSGKVVRGENSSKKYLPKLPVPKNRNPRKRLSFIRAQDEVEAVSRFLFGESDQDSSIIGGECFDRTLKESKDEC